MLIARPQPDSAEPIVGELALSHAAFLVSAARFTTWPDDVFRDVTSPLVFCVYKDRETGQALQERLQGETIRGRALRQIDIDSFQQLSQCHVVFLPTARIGEFQATTDTHGVLTVSDCREFPESEGMIGFLRSEQGVDVIINPGVLTRSGLSISPSLLQMAELVKIPEAEAEIRAAGQ